jgi:hypothetical protein
MPDTYSIIAQKDDDRKELCEGSAKSDDDTSIESEDAWSTAATNGSNDDSSDDDVSPGCKDLDSTAQVADMYADSIQRWLDQLTSEEPWTRLGSKPSTTDPASNTSNSSEV